MCVICFVFCVLFSIRVSILFCCVFLMCFFVLFVVAFLGFRCFLFSFLSCLNCPWAFESGAIRLKSDP